MLTPGDLFWWSMAISASAIVLSLAAWIVGLVIGFFRGNCQ